jgi:tocopherol cyclase
MKHPAVWPFILLVFGILCLVATTALTSPNRMDGWKYDKKSRKLSGTVSRIAPLMCSKAYPEETPHSGRHFLPSHPAYRKPKLRRMYWKRRRRFMEGWYYRLTLVEHNVSFAFIVSIEDPGIMSSDLNLACIQVIGPEDGYLVQADKDDTKFWAAKKTQSLGCTFEYHKEVAGESGCITEMDTQEWRRKVKSGFQVSRTHLLGRIRGHDGSAGVLQGMGKEGYCEFDFSISPMCGWGGSDSNKQKSTAGWLASFEVFEPHWQVTMADARASGSVTWENTTYVFEDEPFYAEKNWGNALPSKWYWTQCNSFEGYDELSITAGGGIRKLPFGQKEALGMIGVTLNGTFYEAVPWNGMMSWNVSAWGHWSLQGECTAGNKPFAVEVQYKCDPSILPGLVFRAPTPDEGMVYFCRDTFEASTTLSLWELISDENGRLVRKFPPVIDNATSAHGGAEVGGKYCTP